MLHRGEAITGENGNVIVHGKALGKETGTVQNYGLNKIIYKHGVPRGEVVKIPRYIKKNQPIEVNVRKQHIYRFPANNEEFKLSTTPIDDYRTISSMYKYIPEK